MAFYDRNKIICTIFSQNFTFWREKIGTIALNKLGFVGRFLPPLSLAERLGRGVGSDLVLGGDVWAVDGN